MATEIPLDRATAKKFDSEDIIASARDEFYIPTRAEVTQNKEIADPDAPSLYLCGNSLGLQPKLTRKLLDEELNVWASNGVYGHFRHPHSRPWVTIDETVTSTMADIVGARKEEVAVMATLTTNLHLLMAAFYKPTTERYKIIIEHKAFPSDHYAVESQIQMHDLSVDQAMVTIKPPANSKILPTDYILSIIKEHASTTALVLLPGVQYYTGQAFDIQQITAYAKSLGIIVGWDLAHAAGNLALRLHDWDVDFAAWCSYKYLNAGPGGIAGLFVHEKQSERPRLTGWWAHEVNSRFMMDNHMKVQYGAAGFQLSNPSVLDTIALLGSLTVFRKYTMKALRAKSVALTGYLETLLLSRFPDKPFLIITPSDPEQRGAQLSLAFADGMMDEVNQVLQENGVTCDERKPDVIRVAPTPLYNSFEDVWVFVDQLRKAVDIVFARRRFKSAQV
ncbi:pyridoxal phosphate-dependent transferase [Lipomyces tetrasporus]|uniref:Kynureninase n=1 Tax=Lipomyces tetrasporus TaxID=54092 RepID=A0AAD7QYN4_9ASCO|nr:pyridoxal phosphate-dependent transferase [Lipomyces tetrasporus]KAJ8103874.1 pyridoxal phosphate-dependent transferase [Lipomyces tetrasporus]